MSRLGESEQKWLTAWNQHENTQQLQVTCYISDSQPKTNTKAIKNNKRHVRSVTHSLKPTQQKQSKTTNNMLYQWRTAWNQHKNTQIVKEVSWLSSWITSQRSEKYFLQHCWALISNCYVLSRSAYSQICPFSNQDNQWKNVLMEHNKDKNNVWMDYI